ncbi:MAG: GEVED domain-containing protein, partial [Cyanobacteria bacterium P01_H01_bin.105]
MKSLFDYLKPIAQKIDAKRIVLHASELRKDSSKKITLASALLLSAGTILGATPQHAVAQTNPSYPNFDQRYNVEIPGNLEAIGNASVICDRNNASCADGLANGTRGNNNGSLPMQMLDIDSDGSTFNSSSAQLNLPAGANVRFAALYWGGSLEGFGTTPAPNLTGFNQVSLQVPGSGSYQTITANDQNDRTDFGSWHTYGAFADITTLVQGAGNGTYTVANVQSNTGAGFTYPNAGWSIVVVYEDPAQPVRNISIFDGHDVVRNSFKTFNLTGVRTPPTSGFDVFMGAIANDGEIDQPDDFLHINNNNITDGLNPANNFFNGTISKFGSHVTSRTPNDPFNMVIDIDYLDLTSWNQANNAIPTNATSIDLTLESQGDGIWPLAYFFAVQVFEPNLVAQFEKTTPSTSYVNGDVIPYTISVTNTGNDNATDTVITDAIPTGTTFVPGSLKIGGVTKTDGAGDDEAEFDGSNVIFRVGSGANATQGGQVNINDTVTMTFDVTVTAAPGDLVCNQASIDYEGQTSGNAGSGNSDDPNTPTFGDCTEITTTASAAKDYGDAPDTYGTNDASGGPSHTIVGGIHLGTAPDGESDAETPLDGSGDGAEDDGITLTTLTEGDPSYTIPAGNITATGSGTLHAWLDFDKSGTFELGEYTSIAVTSGTPAGDLSWSGITAGAAGNTYARFRFTSDASINANTPGGAASDGEVEDYQVAIAATPTNFAISGQVRNDTDNDGDLNDADSGISNVTVDLYDDPEGDGDPTGSTELTTKFTDGSGNYSFENLAPGNYIVIETDTNGYTSTNDSDNF